MVAITCTIIVMGAISAIAFFIIRPYLNEKIKLRDKEIKNAKYSLYASIDPNLVEKSIDEYIERYIQRYITYKFVASRVEFIKDKDTEDMIRDITKLIAVQIPDLYVFYLGCINNINNDEDLVTMIHNKVSVIAVEQVTNYNSAPVL